MKDVDIKRLENRLINSYHSINKFKNTGKKDFASILENTNNNDKNIKFSKHAETRMGIRNIDLNGSEMDRLKSAFNKAEQKGINEALIILGDKAFIASIRNKTVITAVNKEQLKNNVFTNIDGAVIV